MPPRTILIVDDSDALRFTFAALLEADGHCVVEAGSLAEARRMLDGALDCVVLDLHLPDGLGTSLVGEVRARQPHAALVLMSGEVPTGALDVDLALEKGLDPRTLGAVIERAIAARRGGV